MLMMTSEENHFHSVLMMTSEVKITISFYVDDDLRGVKSLYFILLMMTSVVVWFNDFALQYNIIKDFMCTFRENCYCASLSWALGLTWVSPIIQDKTVGVWVGRRIGYLATTFALKDQYDPV